MPARVDLDFAGERYVFWPGDGILLLQDFDPGQHTGAYELVPNGAWRNPISHKPPEFKSGKHILSVTLEPSLPEGYERRPFRVVSNPVEI